MKTVSFKKYKYTFKDWFRWISIIFIHYFSFILLAAVVLSFRYIFKDSFLPSNLEWSIIFYPLFIGPFINAMIHILYSERGNVNVKAISWIHTLMIVLWIIIEGFLI